MHMNSSPPQSIEVFGLKIPTQIQQGGILDTYMYDLVFTVENSGKINSDISFTVTLNPVLEESPIFSSPPESSFPKTIYEFGKSGKAYVVHLDRKYFVKGSVEVKTFSTPVGAFDDKRKNFFIDLTYGENGEQPLAIQGIFSLQRIS